MVEIEFNLNQVTTMIQAKLDDLFEVAINKFIQKNIDAIKSNTNKIHFFSSEKLIKSEESIENQMTELEKKNKKMKVLVDIIEDENKNNKETIVKSKDIICPNCHEPCRIKFENYKIKLNGCVNNHEITNIKISDFPKSQEINISKIICDKCKIKNKANCPNEQFYKCLTCNMNLCILCKPNHNSNHNIIRYNQLNYICQKHNDVFDKYCGQCNLNICFSCEDHDKHNNTISLRELKPNIEEKKNILLEIKKEVDYFNNEIRNIINKLNDQINTINIYYEIYNDIINNYETKNRSYQVLSNIKEIGINNDIFKDLKKINGIKDINDKIIHIVELYNKLNLNNAEIQNSKDIKICNSEVQGNIDILNKSKKNKLNEMTIVYNIDENQDQLLIFDRTFVKNNKNKCYILIEGERRELCYDLNLSQKQKENKTITIKLIETETITNMSYMFGSSMISLPDISEWDTEKVIDLNSIFYDCKLLKSLPDISKWNTKNVTNMKYLFGNCSSLMSIPDISKWDTSRVINMEDMFENCSSLKSLPDISRWNISKVINLNHMFSNCSLLITLPDISKWDTRNVTDMSSMFENCNSLKLIPDISKWDTRNVTDMSSMFENCNSLKSLPDISNWDTRNVANMSFMFEGCDKKLVPKKFK